MKQKLRDHLVSYYTPHSVGECIGIRLKFILDRLLLHEDAVSNVETTTDSWRE